MDRRHDERARAIDAVRDALEADEVRVRRHRTWPARLGEQPDFVAGRAVYVAHHHASDAWACVPASMGVTLRNARALILADALLCLAVLIVDSPPANGWWPAEVERPEWATPGSRDGWLGERTAA